MMDRHSLDTLEFPKVLELIRGKCLTPFGMKVIEQKCPLHDADEIRRHLTEISQMKDIITFGDAFPLYRLEDSTELISKSTVDGLFLDPSEMLTILELIEVSIGINNYNRDDRENFSLIAVYLEKIRAFPELKQDINRTIDETGEIKDSASPELRRLRRELADSKRAIINKLERILTSHRKQPGWQDDVVTQRSGRYVIPVPSNHYRNDVGILHDRSQSGATLFVEPKETVELNNKLNILAQEERFEMDRILRALTAEIATRAGALIENTRLIGVLDSIHAAATFSEEIKGSAPRVIDEPSLDLKDVRHPLLITQFRKIELVAPTNLNLGESQQALLITGPNTGGKTILLKNVGLAVLMAQSGLHISADAESTVGIFKNVFADIGDEQSIELSLSTFSSHVKNIISGLRGTSGNALLLFDEIGAGTDPKEGAALAESIISYAIDRGARLLATTHYSQLKTLALDHPEIENASLEFDRESLAPTYRLHIGIPGSSYAVEIARRLGMPESICANAAKLVGSGERSLGSLIATLQAELSRLREDRENLTEKLAKTEELRQHYTEQSERLKAETEERRNEALDKTEILLKNSRAEVERLVSEIRNSQASKKTVRKFHQMVENGQNRVKHLKAKDRKKTDTGGIPTVGDRVEILSLERRGDVEALIGTDRAKVRVGNVLTTVELRNLRKIGSDQPKPRTQSVTGQQANESESREINLLGMTVDEASTALDRFLDQSVIAGLKQVYVIHGKGTGRLRKGLSTFLKAHLHVDSIRLGDFNEGGAGVTVVKLR